MRSGFTSSPPPGEEEQQLHPGGPGLRSLGPGWSRRSLGKTSWSFTIWFQLVQQEEEEQLGFHSSSELSNNSSRFRRSAPPLPPEGVISGTQAAG